MKFKKEKNGMGTAYILEIGKHVILISVFNRYKYAKFILDSMDKKFEDVYKKDNL